MTSDFYGHFLFFYNGNPVPEQLTVSYTRRRRWEVALGKYDNWCLFIVFEICSTAQWNTPLHRGCGWLHLVSKPSKIIHINTALRSKPSSDVLHKNSCQLPQHKSVLHFAQFPLCVLRTHAVLGEMARCEAFGRCCIINLSGEMLPDRVDN